MELNNRELASLILLAALLVPALLNTGFRQAVGAAWRTIRSLKAALALALMVGYVVGLARLGARLGIWTPDLVKETIVWFLTVGVVSFVNLNESISDRRYVWRVLLRTIEIVAVLEFVAGIFVLSLLAELALQAVLLVAVLLTAMSERDHPTARKVADVTLALAGFGFVGYSLFQLVVHGGQIAGPALVLEGALPVWMTLGFLPFIYAFTLYGAYELPLSRIADAEDASLRRRWRAAIALIAAFKWQHDRFRGFGHYEVREMVKADSFAESRRVADEFLQRVRRKEAKEREYQRRLVEYAGVQGEDKEGKRLDRREFEATTKALDWLATCQMGQYRKLGHYREDMLEIVATGGRFDELPPEHGVVMHVASDGRKWWAYRRTITGWCFAVGAATEPPDLWRHDGTDPPEGPPGTDPSWGTDPLTDPRDTNWF